MHQGDKSSNTDKQKRQAAHRSRNHQIFVRANDANRGPAGVRGTRLPMSPHCETHSAFEAGS
jgi:hypothetical protein